MDGALVSPYHPLLDTLPMGSPLGLPPEPVLALRQKVSELETQQRTLENIVSVLSRELGRRGETSTDALGEAMARILYLEEKVAHQDSLMALKDVMISSLGAQLQTLEQTTYDGKFLWKIPVLELKLREAQTGQRAVLHSPPFYTSRYGYKVRLKLFLTGDGAGARTHLSLFLVIMKGEYDFQLKWPFRHKVTFTLLDQANGHHFSTSFHPVESSSFQRPVSEANVASGIPQFFPLSQLQVPTATYVHEDTMAIRAVIDTTV
uniref:MATH domain-containing protein n=1 Tax=Sphenodon punctatus TaxID=8508 RepID=A0A8D0GZF2_SPHPU